MTSPQPGDAGESGPWWGTAAAATQCEGAAPRADWAGWEAEGRAPGVARRQRLPHPLRRRLRPAGRARRPPPPPHGRVGPPGARGPGGGTTTRSPTCGGCSAAARAVGRRRRGRACCTDRRPGWFTDDQRGLARRQGRAHLGPPRRPGGRGDRRPGGRAGSRSTSPSWRPASATATARSLRAGANDDDHRDARAALLAAEAEAARLLRSGPAPGGRRRPARRPARAATTCWS